ncbi:hypothetical protein KP509_22G052700 [Ceratopteris richardii]|uniref:Uncharacterized protein n=1 Tax=Ceratopteris richardii TaxID=49495 RepID=A0A8T2S8B6_CERRI|nr:hypothetical protein KP509_22G052700 [Ceratopteris richardii]
MTSGTGEPQALNGASPSPLAEIPGTPSSKRHNSCSGCGDAEPRGCAASAAAAASPPGSRRSSIQRQDQRKIQDRPPSSSASSSRRPSRQQQCSTAGASPETAIIPYPAISRDLVTTSNQPNFPNHIVCSSSSTSLLSSNRPGFTLDFNTRNSRPNIKCRIDHLHQDLELDVKLEDGCDGSAISDNGEKANTDVSNPKITLSCYKRSDPNNEVKLRVELLKTSGKGYALRVVHCKHRRQSSDCSSAGELHRLDRGESGSRRSSLRSDSGRSGLRTKDISELDEVRISSGKISKDGDDDVDVCRCTTPCGDENCKARELHTELQVTC